MKVAVIGAGASGIIAALKASETNEVILIDKNSECGKKLLVTGNGRCNYWHDDIKKDDYHTDDYNKLSDILSYKEEVFAYLSSLGLYPKIKDGYYYPQANSAYSVREIFAKELTKRKIELKYNFEVKEIKKEANGFKIISDKDIINCDKVIVATGSKAMPKTGSDGFAYKLASNYSLKVNPVLPSLVGLYTSESFLKNWSGIRCDAEVSLLINGKKIKTENGEIQLTDNGISGICVFNISSDAIRSVNNNENVIVHINFAPFTDDFNRFFEERSRKVINQNLKELCESLFNYKLSSIFFNKSGINPNAHWQSLTNKEKDLFGKTITDFCIKIDGYGSFDKAQVCTGGISLSEINSKTMECQKIKGLFFIGEALDVDGICGGYNLSFAFISGFVAGKGI